MNVECVADFVDGSLSVTYGDEVAEGSEEYVEENIEEVVEEIAE
jgi:hypothetical protein